MNILYILSAHGKGIGGHIHSLNNVARAMNGYKGINAKIATLGNVDSPILKNNDNYITHLDFKWHSFFKLNKKFKKILKEYPVDIIHCFDGGTALMLMLLPVFWKTHIIHTKCGGPNERDYFAQVLDTVILFSKENLKAFKKNPRFKNTEIHLIPNRVYIQHEESQEDRELLKRKSGVFTFLRIARIGPTYKDSIAQGLELVKRLFEKGLNVRYVVIGVIEDEAVLEELKGKAKDLPVEFYTEKEYTSEAAKFLYIADAVIGTGRGLMEAMAKGKPVFAPLKGRELPAYVNKETFESLFTNNFSQRNELTFYKEGQAVEDAQKLVNNSDVYKKEAEFAFKTAEENFLITKKIKEKYYHIYDKQLTKKRKKLVSRNIVPILYYLNVYRRVNKRTSNS